MARWSDDPLLDLEGLVDRGLGGVLGSVGCIEADGTVGFLLNPVDLTIPQGAAPGGAIATINWAVRPDYTP